MIDFALRQLRAQRGVPFEVIIGLHGAWDDTQAVSERAKATLDNCEVLEIPADVTFPAALNRLAAAASGSVLVKMDDDDWYAPEFLADLLLARSYSRADLVGCGLQFVYLENENTTIRRRRTTETFDQPSSGGTLMLDATLLYAVGGFRTGKSVGDEDSELQRTILAEGGTIYRSHALNYVLRRRGEGHTWRVDDEFFLRQAIQTWPGLQLTGLFDGPLDPSSEPGPAAGRTEVDG
jgi:glycosyltransferase involved in cell wall biosynthesis